MKENKAKLIASICKKLETEGTDEELEYLRELWKNEERESSGLYTVKSGSIDTREWVRGIGKFHVSRGSSVMPTTHPNLQGKTSG